MLVDYIFAFGALGLSGLFSKSKNGLVKGYIAGVLGRYFFAFLSGMIFFGAYAADYGMSAPVYSPGLQRHLSVRGSGADADHPLPASGQKVMGQLKPWRHRDKAHALRAFQIYKKESGAQSYRCLTPDSFYRTENFVSIR